MNVSYRWLRSLAPAIEGTPEELAERLGMLGAPVDDIVDLGAGLADVVIARVEEVRQHPNADRLRLCTVRAGDSLVQVVCGAPNVEAGRFYPFAPSGATLPGGIQIRRAKLRGEVSDGMLCSPRELGLGRDHMGLMTLSGDWKPGSSFVEQIGLNDTRLVLDVTPNRPDLLSHLGVARELAPAGVKDILIEPFSPGSLTLEIASDSHEAMAGGVRVRVEDSDDCPRYMAVVMQGVRVGPSPEWLATRLRSVGVRPINNVVDATNFVLLELGQPLHAFDLDRLAGAEIRVRRARTGESIRTLDGVDRTLDPHALVIADAERPVALAGIMGGEHTEVTEGTTRLLLECALFDATRVRKTARFLGLSTDASQRFERGVDAEQQPRAAERLADLIRAVAGGEVVSPALDVRHSPSSRRSVELRPLQVRKLLGVEISGEEIDSLLQPIGFTIRKSGTTLQVDVPAYRPDVTREVDLIEEVARRRGYDSFNADLDEYRPGVVPPDELLQLQNPLHALLARWGLLEARTAAFAPEAEGRVPLLNPLSMEESHLRDSLLPGLLRRVEHNWSHGVRDVRLYEIGTVFRPGATETGVEEEIRIAGVATGRRSPSHWGGGDPSWDVYDVKGLVEELEELVGPSRLTPAEGEGFSQRFDPREAIDVVEPSGSVIGFLGQVARSAIDAPLWADPVYAFERVLRGVGERPHPTFEALPIYPASERDLALLVPSGVSAGQVEAIIVAAGRPLLEQVHPFDLFAGKGIPEGSRSIGWRMRFRDSARTLTDLEVDGAVDRILRRLEEEFDVHRR